MYFYGLNKKKLKKHSYLIYLNNYICMYKLFTHYIADIL